MGILRYPHQSHAKENLLCFLRPPPIGWLLKETPTITFEDFFQHVTNILSSLEETFIMGRMRVETEVRLKVLIHCLGV